MAYVKRNIVTIITVVVVMLGITAVQAEWPEKPIKTFVGYGAGGGTDTYARILSSLIHEELDGTPMIVINKTGASSMIALKHVFEQPADGYTVLMQAVGPAVVAEILGKSPVKFQNDMVPIALLGQVPAVLAVPFDSPHKTVDDLIEYAQKNPGKMRWSSPGRADYLGVGFGKIAKSLGMDIKDVPFKGGAPAKAAIVAGQVDMGVIGIQHLVGFESKLRGLGAFSATRSAIKEDVPTFLEQGHDVSNLVNVFAVFVKAGTPEHIVAKLRIAAAAVVQKKGYKRLIAKAGLNNGYMDAAATDALIAQMFVDLSK